MARKPVETETRTRVVELMAEGKLGRNAIAREVGLAGSTITMIAQEIGHEFDRSQSELARRIRTIDIADMRAKLAKASLDEAWRTLEDMRSPATMVHFEAGGQYTDEDGKIQYKRGSFREHVLDEPTYSDKRNLATVYGIMITKSAELTRQVDGANVSDGSSVLDGLRIALQGAANALADVDPTVIPDPDDHHPEHADPDVDLADRIRGITPGEPIDENPTR